jgi:hypothetical protein
MKYYQYISTVIFSLILAACGSGSSKSESPPEPVNLNENNLSQAIQIQGSESVNTSIPSDLTATEITGSTKVIVSANSTFKLKLSVPYNDDKSVAGYLIELPGGSQQFIKANTNTTQDSVTTAYYSSEKPIKLKRTSFLQVSNTSTTNHLTDDNRSGETDVVISGWSGNDFTLERSIEDLKVRIFPLLINKNILNITNLTFEEILTSDGFDMSFVQELELAVEAVATSTVQISLTWNTETDLDLYILEPNYNPQQDTISNIISYFNHISPTSLGWLDRDNTEAYGPENITFNYQMPIGEYKVAVNYFYGDVATDYSVTIAIGDNEPVVLTGSFTENTSNAGDLSDTVGTHNIHTFNVDDTLNAQLSPKVPLSQYAGVWQLPEDSSLKGYVKIGDGKISIYTTNEIEAVPSCNLLYTVELDYLPTGFKTDNGLQISDAMIFSGENNTTYAYRTPIKVSDNAVDNCTEYEYEE